MSLLSLHAFVQLRSGPQLSIRRKYLHQPECLPQLQLQSQPRMAEGGLLRLLELPESSTSQWGLLAMTH